MISGKKKSQRPRKALLVKKKKTKTKNSFVMMEEGGKYQLVPLSILAEVMASFEAGEV